MKKIIFLVAIGLGITTGYAQNPPGITIGDTLKSLTNTLKIPVDKTKAIFLTTSDASVDVEGYDGDDLIVEAVTNKFKPVIPPEAEGLAHIKFDNRPAEANTVSYKLFGANNIIISTKCKYLHIKVPNHLYLLSIDANDMSLGGYLSVKNLVGPFEIGNKTGGSIRTIYISNVAGPFGVLGKGEKVVISNIAWNKNALWPGEVKAEPWPYKVSSTGDIDITLPEDLKATIVFFPGPVNGEVYSDMNLANLSTDGSKMGFLKVNGGGVGIFTYNTNRNRGNTYIRKQKN